jgi:hypothetical protein
MRRLWSALLATVPLLIGGVGTASAQMHGGGRGWHGGHFHDGRLFRDGRFHHAPTNFGAFTGASAFWWGAPYSPVSYYDGPYTWPVYGDPGPTTYMQQYGSTAAQSGAGQTSGGEFYDCTDQAGYYSQVQTCAKGGLKVVPDDHKPAVVLKSKELNSAEQFAKANGCPAPVAKMNFAVFGVDNFEAFTVACGTDAPMSIRCDYGQCRVM